MSETPRTDAVSEQVNNAALAFDMREYRGPAPEYVVDVDFARTLERELAAAIAERDALRQGFNSDGETAREACCRQEKQRLASELAAAKAELAECQENRSQERADNEEDLRAMRMRAEAAEAKLPVDGSHMESIVDVLTDERDILRQAIEDIGKASVFHANESHPIVGFRKLAEERDSFKNLWLELSEQEMKG